MFTFAIIDDLKDAQEQVQELLVQYCKKHHFKYMIDCYSNPLKFSFKKHYDAIFLDIDMPELNGITLAKEIKQKNPTYIIFITQYTNYMHVVFDVQPFHFIDKHNLGNEANHVLPLLFNELNANKIRLNTKRGNVDILICNIYYITISEGITTVYTKQDSYDMWETISSLAGKLKIHHFEKINQSTIVNLRYVNNIIDDKVILDNQTELKLSTRTKSIFLKTYKEYLLNYD